jgi:hypothetical protein
MERRSGIATAYEILEDGQRVYDAWTFATAVVRDDQPWPRSHKS